MTAYSTGHNYNPTQINDSDGDKDGKTSVSEAHAEEPLLGTH
ncbi:MAG: hypothetical protein RID53_09650 [Coleofasciculus sp. B1-GNL1-01]